MERLGAVQRQRSSRRRLTVAVLALLALSVPAAYTYASADTPQPADKALLAAAQSSGQHAHGAAPTPEGDQQPAEAEPDAEKPAGEQTAGEQNPGQQNPGQQDGQNSGTAAAQPAEDKPALPNNGLDVLGRDCSNSSLDRHTGFQIAPACVDTAFGEVAAEERSPSLLITDAPRDVGVGQPFTIAVSTRNLVRDRFLGAAAGGYYLESSFLDGNGLQRGHFHTACRMLGNDDEAPDAAPAPAFFLATQDNGGGAKPDTVEVQVPGLPSAGEAQCTVWAGDGSHRIPMMQRANQTPAVDSIRIGVK